MTDDDCDDPDDALRLLLLCLRTQIWNSWFSGFETAAGRDGSLQDAGRTAAKDFDLNWAENTAHVQGSQVFLQENFFCKQNNKCLL